MSANPYEIKSIVDYIAGNPYVGRGIAIGFTEDASKAVCAYFIMGRSENSRNRVFVEEGDDIMIKPFDESKVEDPSLIIYYPVRKVGKSLIVTNGDQTDTVAKYSDGEDALSIEQFMTALMTRKFEPDSPNWTPRISGLMNLDYDQDFCYQLSILKSANPEGSACNRYFFDYEAVPGTGHFIHTYITDGNPIPTFVGEPEKITIPSDIDEFTAKIWSNLNEQNKISLYVRYTDIETGEYVSRLINKNK